MHTDDRLERIQKESLKLISVIDKEFNLNDTELDLVIKSIWNGLNKSPR